MKKAESQESKKIESTQQPDSTRRHNPLARAPRSAQEILGMLARRVQANPLEVAAQMGD